MERCVRNIMSDSKLGASTKPFISLLRKLDVFKTLCGKITTKFKVVQ